MILDRLEHAGRYRSLHPLFSHALDVVLRADLPLLPAGRHDIAGDRLYLSIAMVEGKTQDNAVLESHRRYIDIHYVIGGNDMIGWKPVRECGEVTHPYDTGNDIEFYADRPLCWSPLSAGTFAIYFPEDAHAPLGGTGRLHRAVVKVALHGGSES